MGVHGLWRLIEPSGKPVPLETLESKVLAVDVSIWLHQLVKGFQDSKGAPLPNAHLLGIYHRVCKLLYFRIKPVFVFDGGVPVLKKQTIAKRNQQKQKSLSEADRIHKNLLSTLLKHSAISKVLSEKAKAAITASTSPTKKSKKDEDDLYMLPPSSSLESTMSSIEEEESSSEDSSPTRHLYDLHSIDTKSVQFKSLPADVRHEILTDLKETRKQSSWGRIHELPTESDDFSGYQMRRLLKRQSVQTALEEVEKEMGGHSLSLGELEQILKDQGVISNNQIKGTRIASDENTRFLLIKDVKQAIEEAKKHTKLPTVEEASEESTINDEDTSKEKTDTVKNKGDIEFEDDLQKAIALSLEEEPSTSKECIQKTPEKAHVIGRKGKNRMPLSFLSNFDDADFDSESSEEEIVETISKFTSAQKYMIENSTLTTSQIAKLITSKAASIKKSNEEAKNISKIADDKQIQQEISDIDRVEIISDDEEQLEELDGVTENSQPEEKVLELNSKDEVLETVNTTAEKKAVDKNEVLFDEPSEDGVGKNPEEKEPERNEVEGNEKDATVEIMSDSESSTCDDFLDVDEPADKEILNKETTSVPYMEVIIKPDEEIQDDLFKDVFTSEDTSMDDSRERIQEESVPTNHKAQNNTEAVLIETESEQPKTPGNLTMKDKIENMIKEYSRPKTQENADNSTLSEEQLKEMRDNLRQEEAELVAQKSNKERVAGNITDQMYQEAQELLELFGVPYLIAPMEAEAQCAFLELIDLTDGTITDDSDIWLFGGRTVYKNFFNQKKTVLEFKAENILNCYKLTREQMILLAMLVGSDYTVGLSGVGPVTALEILAAFPPKKQLISGLAEFRSWFNKGKLPGPRRTALRSKLKNVSFTEGFPNPQIIQAYLEPQVETSKEKFSWAKPDVVGLVDYAREKFGWTKIKTEEILNPVLKRLEEHSQQKSILDYFRRDYTVGSGQTEKKMSKRVQTAINRIGKTNGQEDAEEEPKPKRKKPTKSEGAAPKKRQAGRKAKKVDEDVQVLKETEARSQVRVAEIHKEVHKEIESQKAKKVNLGNLHKKEVIPQKQKEKTDMLKNKLKAIETFRKSKQGPGYVKKKAKVVNTPKKDASYLSESSESD